LIHFYKSLKMVDIVKENMDTSDWFEIQKSEGWTSVQVNAAVPPTSLSPPITIIRDQSSNHPITTSRSKCYKVNGKDVPIMKTSQSHVIHSVVVHTNQKNVNDLFVSLHEEMFNSPPSQYVVNSLRMLKDKCGCSFESADGSGCHEDCSFVRSTLKLDEFEAENMFTNQNTNQFQKYTTVRQLPDGLVFPKHPYERSVLKAENRNSKIGPVKFQPIPAKSSGFPHGYAFKGQQPVQLESRSVAKRICDIGSPVTTAPHNVSPMISSAEKMAPIVTTAQGISGQHNMPPVTNNKFNMAPVTTASYNPAPDTIQSYNLAPVINGSYNMGLETTTPYNLANETTTSYTLTPKTTASYNLAPATHNLAPETSTSYNLVPGTSTSYNLAPVTTSSYTAASGSPSYKIAPVGDIISSYLSPPSEEHVESNSGQYSIMNKSCKTTSQHFVSSTMMPESGCLPTPSPSPPAEEMCDYTTATTNSIMVLTTTNNITTSSSHHCCSYCNSSFDTVKQLTKHTRNHHHPYTCKICGLVTEGYYQMASHTKKEHQKHPVYFCECGRNFAEKKGMTKHQNTCRVVNSEKSMI